MIKYKALCDPDEGLMRMEKLYRMITGKN